MKNDNTMKQKVIILVLINLISLNISAQRGEEIKVKLDEANIAFNNKDFKEAILLYLEILDRTNIEEAKINLAESYRKIENWNEAEYWYGQIVHLPEAKSIYTLYYGKALQANGKCDLAIEWFLKYSRLEPNDWRGQLLAQACQKDSLHPKSSRCKNCEILPLEINTKYDDYSPIIYQDKLVFTSGYNSIGWLRSYIGSLGWETPKIYSSQIDTLDEFNNEYLYGSKELIMIKGEKKLNASAIFTNDGKRMFFNEANVTDAVPNLKLNLSMMQKTDTGWNKVEEFPFNSEEYSVAHPALSTNEDTLYFSSDMSGGFGGMDLYFSVRTNGNWSKPINLGGEINTEGHEVFPFYHKTGKLYFSSDGQFESKGLDIFYINLNNKSRVITRLPEPINSKYSEHGFIMNDEETFGYFSSDREGGLGKDDIYGVRIMGELDEKN